MGSFVIRTHPFVRVAIEGRLPGLIEQWEELYDEEEKEMNAGDRAVFGLHDRGGGGKGTKSTLAGTEDGDVGQVGNDVHNKNIIKFSPSDPVCSTCKRGKARDLCCM